MNLGFVRLLDRLEVAAIIPRVAVVVGVLSLGCRSSAPELGPKLGIEARAVSDWVNPPGASVSTSREVRLGMTSTTTWELLVSLTWSAYQDRLRGAAVHGGYHENESNGVRETFSRIAGGDMYILSIDVLSSGPPLRVRLSLTATPD